MVVARDGFLPKAVFRNVLTVIRRKSTHDQGLLYEKQVQKVLHQYSFQLVHRGGSHDRGIDLMGHWDLPEHQVPIIVQCKNEAKAVGPNYIREFEGVLHRRVKEMEKESTHPPIGLLVGSNGFSVASFKQQNLSTFPIIFATVLEEELVTFRLNSAVERILPKLQIATKHVQGDGLSVRPVLLYNNVLLKSH